MSALEVYQAGSVGESIVVFGNLAEKISRTDFVPQEFRGRPEAVLACMMYGQELGLGPMQSLNLTQSIKGRVGLKPEGMRALVLAAGHKIWTEEFSDTRVVLCGQRQGEDEVERVDWDMDRAKKAGLGTGDNWRKYTRAMLLARATSELCRLKFADIVGGLSYTPDELAEFDEPVHVPPAQRRERSAPVVDAPAAELPAPVMARTRPSEGRKVVQAGSPDDLAPPSTGPRKRKPPTPMTPTEVQEAENEIVDAEIVEPVNGPLASEADREAIATILKQYTRDPENRKLLGDEWQAAGITSFKAVERFTAADAERAFDLLAEFQAAHPAGGEPTQPTLDGDTAA